MKALPQPIYKESKKIDVAGRATLTVSKHIPVPGMGKGYYIYAYDNEINNEIKIAFITPYQHSIGSIGNGEEVYEWEHWNIITIGIPKTANDLISAEKIAVSFRKIIEWYIGIRDIRKLPTLDDIDNMSKEIREEILTVWFDS